MDADSHPTDESVVDSRDRVNDATEVSQSFVPKEGADDPEESRNTDVTSPRDGVGADAGAEGDADNAPVYPQQGEGGNNIGRWTMQEHNLFLKGLEKFGKDWRKISTIVPTRTLIQIRTHAQKYFQKNEFGMKYDRVTDNADAAVERRRPPVKRKVNRPHSRNTYQSSSRSPVPVMRVIQTRSHTPSPVPDETVENESNGKEPVSPLPSEYQPESESKESTLQSFPVHYNRSLRASAMCLSSEDCFSRRITSLGVYYPKDRLKQERQFARVVLELLAKKVAEEKGEGDEKGDENGNFGEPTDNHSDNTNNHSDNTNNHSDNTNNHSDNTNNHSDNTNNHSDNTNNHSDNTNNHSDNTNNHSDNTNNHSDNTNNHSDNTNNHSDNTNNHSDNTNNHSDNTNNHSDNTNNHSDNTNNHSDNTNNHSDNTNNHSDNSPPNNNTTHTNTQITTNTNNPLPDSHQPTDEGNSHAENQQDSTHEGEYHNNNHNNNTTQDNLPPHAILSPAPPVITSVLDSLSQSTIPHPKSERKVSIIDAIQPPPPNVRPSLRLTNPDRLILVQEDDRQDFHAPRTPANVRGKRSLLHKAVLTSEQATLDFINQQGGNITAINYFVNQADPHGFTPLMTSVCLSDPVAAMNITKILVENGANLETTDRDGNTSLFWAIIVGNEVIVHYLLSQKASLEATDHEGNTPLHVAVLHGHLTIALTLLQERKESITQQNKHHHTPLNILNSSDCHLSKEEKMTLREAFYRAVPSLRTVIIHHPDCLLHVPRMNGSQGANPWEAPARMDAILSELRTNLKDWEVAYDSAFDPASSKDILRAHSQRYLKLLCDLNESLDKDQSVAFTPHVQNGFGVPSDKIKDEAICDTSFSKGSLQAALRAAGGAIHAVDKIVSNEFRNAFACIRPPGHHAGTDGLLTTASSCGFCVFNNVMIAALYALDTYPDLIHRIAIVDIDIHHGNGTEQILKRYNHPEKIMFWSSHIYFNDAHHDYEFYPGTGKADFVFENIYNQPLQPLWETEHSRRHDGEGGRVLFRKAVEDRLLPLLTAFKPDLIIMSSGFDGGHGDVGNYRHVPTVQVGMNLKISDYTWALQKVQEVADFYCHGHLISMLEGGYGSYEKRKSDGEVILGRTSLAHNVLGHIHGLLCEEEAEMVQKKPSGTEGFCGCGEHKDEEMIECMCGKVCGGWVHFSCAGINLETFHEDERDQFICKWCRAAGVSVGKSEEKKEEPKEEESITSRLRPRVKREGKEKYEEEEEEPHRKPRKRAKYSGYGSSNNN
ncbi:hypothetical protein WA588_004286, partial [Blastocystis sp. NMH]